MEQTIEVCLDGQGRLRIPAAASESLGLSPGMTLVVEEADAGGVQLRVQGTAAEIVEEDGFLVVRGDPGCDLTTFIQDERERRIQDIIRQSGL